MLLNDIMPMIFSKSVRKKKNKNNTIIYEIARYYDSYQLIDIFRIYGIEKKNNNNKPKNIG